MLVVSAYLQNNPENQAVLLKSTHYGTLYPLQVLPLILLSSPAIRSQPAKMIHHFAKGNVIKDPGYYSICYAKPDGSIVSRSVTRPNFPGYITVPSSVASNRGRGRRPLYDK
ncbi:hypothetical protein CEXT_193861 [Caerostris extrusa]|uniref:Uncharacterized protein n=1 Tax=Caerostris extrusa TaxID=172846 RepID=A0AAV4UNC2_CAEEX|nr:hypothetical protein CEXT_193861 [Caerostris extrusa]